MNVCVCVCDTAHESLCGEYVCVCVCDVVYVYVFVCVNVCVRARTHACLHACILCRLEPYGLLSVRIIACLPVCLSACLILTQYRLVFSKSDIDRAIQADLLNAIN